MTEKQKKSILNSFSKIEGRIQELDEEIKCLLSSSTNSSNSGMPMGGRSGSKTETIVEMLENSRCRLEREKIQLEIARNRIITAISNLPNITERRILHLKYIGKPDGKYHRTIPLWEIANILGYSVDRVNHLHGQALKEIKL